MTTQQLSKRFISRNEATDIAAQMQNIFLVGTFNSQSRVSHIAHAVAEHLGDEGIFPKRSLCLMIAKLTLTMWIESNMKVKAIHASK